MPSSTFASRVLTPGGHLEQEKLVTAFHLAVIVVCTTFIIAVFFAALLLQRYKDKFIFISDSCHPHDEYPAVDHENNAPGGPETRLNSHRGDARDCTTHPASTEGAAPCPPRYADGIPSFGPHESSTSGPTDSANDADSLGPERQTTCGERLVLSSGSWI